MDRNRQPGQPNRLPSTADDEAVAARSRYRIQEASTVTIPADELIAGVLAPGECVVTIRRGVIVDRRTPGVGAGRGLTGDLYVTNQRIILMSAIRLEYALGAISEAIVAGRLLMLRVHDARGLTIQVDDPVTLRLQIAAVRAGRALAAGT